jgi:hypothetical protein
MTHPGADIGLRAGGGGTTARGATASTRLLHLGRKPVLKHSSYTKHPGADIGEAGGRAPPPGEQQPHWQAQPVYFRLST